MRGCRRDPERTEVRVLRRRMPLADARVLDVGCGEGRLARRIAGMARLVVGVDPNETALDRARQLTPVRLSKKIKYRRGTAARPGLSRRRFDVAVFSGSLWWVPREGMVHALRVARSLLRQHGVLVDLRSNRVASARARHDQVFCLSGGRRFYADPLRINRPLADFRAADRAVQEVVRHSLFRLENVDEFDIRSYYNSLVDLEKHAARSPYVTMEDAMRRRLSALLRPRPAAQILVVAQMRLNVLVKT